MPTGAQFAALGYDVAVEESSSHGRLDMAVRTAGHVQESVGLRQTPG